MSFKLLDGRLVSDLVLDKVSRSVRSLKRKGILPKAVIILVGKNPASLSYIRQKGIAAKKTGIACVLEALPENTKTDELIALIQKYNKDKFVHGILVQLPLPAHIKVPLVIREIDPMKDIDGFQAYNLGKMFLSAEFEYLAPCTPCGIITLLEHYKIPVAGKDVVVIGHSNIVGKPLAVMLLNRDATVTVCHVKTKNVKRYAAQADILVSAVGKPKLIGPDMVKRGAVVVDVGTNRVQNKLVGDVDFEKVKRKAAWISPVPGGVGPMTVACLMENIVRAAKRLNSTTNH